MKPMSNLYNFSKKKTQNAMNFVFLLRVGYFCGLWGFHRPPFRKLALGEAKISLFPRPAVQSSSVYNQEPQVSRNFGSGCVSGWLAGKWNVELACTASTCLSS